MYSVFLRRAAEIALATKQKQGLCQVAMITTAAEEQRTQFEALNVTVPNPFVYHVELNRPKKLNAMHNTMWIEIGKCFTELGNDPDCRVIVLSGAGKVFSAGIDLADAAQLGTKLGEHEDVARRCKILHDTIKLYQDAMTSLEKCPKPVISAVHNACIGGAVDLITAADIRYCTNDAWFQVKEVDTGLAADVGTLQRLPRVIGSESLVRELVFTARKMMASEAKECGFVSKVYDGKDSMLKGAIEVATDIAAKSPVAVQVAKRSILYSRDHSVQEGLDHIRLWNMTMVQSEDFMNAAVAQATKSNPPTFSKL
ncbi:Delta(3,5)-Delta(2,4)-dienoyl-CoA isomerase, mitochondrial [Cryptotermes secundus]|uniref:Delta(3,5)-Delta(2,4)-dienoyl-CoA isomerase, mitochondrial n=1 Tax=Cryptotermes secundus TaxID=105785 RepID=A0A2J7RLD2_9NEOP|nr:delta(3,5)-Delta(2,4)-dienoyl-CoA isomerase, mitochondrial isoform X2 [Cryptotermes secundus]PNF41641.1 Delta(3,5)-Delta(2,4)-dienoyl-CoA isomerase, mitochondrial [Cryptotermes secundus]PNF41642.1 Delta(3,5)-Delta(2,4)-dienoyl-CoA isomerase, mitochondrial [Cryptotermes secundus]